MIAERIDPSEWPATVSAGPGRYSLRIETDHGSEVRYVAPCSMWQDRDERTRSTGGWQNGVFCTSPGEKSHSTAIHGGATCEAA